MLVKMSGCSALSCFDSMVKPWYHESSGVQAGRDKGFPEARGNRFLQKAHLNMRSATMGPKQPEANEANGILYLGVYVGQSHHKADCRKGRETWPNSCQTCLGWRKCPWPHWIAAGFCCQPQERTERFIPLMFSGNLLHLRRCCAQCLTVHREQCLMLHGDGTIKACFLVNLSSLGLLQHLNLSTLLWRACQPVLTLSKVSSSLFHWFPN